MARSVAMPEPAGVHPQHSGRTGDRTLEASFGFTPEQLRLRDRVRAYVVSDVAPARCGLDAVRGPEDIPWDVVRSGCDLGLKGLPFPAEFGGGEAGVSTLAMVAEELARGDVSVAYFFKHNWRLADLARRLPDRLREGVIRAICSTPEYLVATAATEEASGSDNHVLSDDPQRGIRLAATRDGTEWVLNGTKTMITNARMAGIYVVSARTDASVPVSRGVTMFAVPADTPGVAFGPAYDKLGQRASIQCDVHFHDVRIPGDSAVSGIGQAMGAARQGTGIASNIVNAAMSVGVATSAFDEALRWATRRVQGGSLIYRHQVVSRDLGLMKTEIEAARSYVQHAARLYDAVGRDMREETSQGSMSSPARWSSAWPGWVWNCSAVAA